MLYLVLCKLEIYIHVHVFFVVVLCQVEMYARVCLICTCMCDVLLGGGEKLGTRFPQTYTQHADTYTCICRYVYSYIHTVHIHSTDTYIYAHIQTTAHGVALCPDLLYKCMACVHMAVYVVFSFADVGAGE